MTERILKYLLEHGHITAEKADEMRAQYRDSDRPLRELLLEQGVVSEEVLLEALSCPDSVVQLSTLSCLQPLLLEAPQVMSLHVDTLITKFLNLSASPSMVR